jgi:hypothetical protein
LSGHSRVHRARRSDAGWKNTRAAKRGGMPVCLIGRKKSGRTSERSARLALPTYRTDCHVSNYRRYCGVACRTCRFPSIDGCRRLPTGSRTFIEIRHAAAPAFKRTYIGQCAETLRPSNQSHVLSAAWAQRQLGPRAFSIHDETRLNAIHARLHWLHLPVRHSLAVVEARVHTPQTSAKRKTDGTLNH